MWCDYRLVAATKKLTKKTIAALNTELSVPIITAPLYGHCSVSKIIITVANWHLYRKFPYHVFPKSRARTVGMHAPVDAEVQELRQDIPA
jgi:hypothetical protein